MVTNLRRLMNEKDFTPIPITDVIATSTPADDRERETPTQEPPDTQAAPRPADEQPKTQPETTPHAATAAGGEHAAPHPKMRRVGSDVTDDNWRAWKVASLNTGLGQKTLLNMAFDYCFNNITPEFLALADKYKELPKYEKKQEGNE